MSNKPSREDDKIFQDAMRDVKPLSSKVTKTIVKNDKQNSEQNLERQKNATLNAIDNSHYRNLSTATIKGSDHISYYKSGVSVRKLKQLKKL